MSRISLPIVGERERPVPLHLGDLAYYDSFTGLIPCKVLDVENGWATEIKITATRGGYKKGERLYGFSPRHVIRRAQIHVKNGQYRIRSDGE